jgi:photosystem I subunit 10
VICISYCQNSRALADTLACGTVGHIIGVGVVLGLKNIGAI